MYPQHLCLKMNRRRTSYRRYLSLICWLNTMADPSRYCISFHCESAVTDCSWIQHIAVTGERKKFKITKLPPYLILHIKRFTKNNWFLEKNPTIVTFPIKNLDLKDCMYSLHSLIFFVLFTFTVLYYSLYSIHCTYCIVLYCTDESVVVTKDIPKEECKYDLISNICHEGEADKGAYRVYLIRRVTHYCTYCSW